VIELCVDVVVLAVQAAEESTELGILLVDELGSAIALRFAVVARHMFDLYLVVHVMSLLRPLRGSLLRS
jgi:hypothetical protein